MRRLFAPAAFVVFLSIAISPLAASEPEDAPDGRTNLARRIEDWHSRQLWSGEGFIGMVTFNEDAFEEVFGSDYFPILYSGFTWYFVDNLGLGFYVGATFMQGNAVGEITGEESGEGVDFFAVPVQANLRYRFRFYDGQPIVPSIYFGGDYWYFQENNEFQDDVEGDKTGFHYGADVAFLLDNFDKRSAHRMKKTWGIENTYFTMGYDVNQVGEDEEGLEFSGGTLKFGLTFDVIGSGMLQ